LRCFFHNGTLHPQSEPKHNGCVCNFAQPSCGLSAKLDRRERTRIQGPSTMKKKATSPSLKVLKKSPTGIRGLDEITGGGLPTGRPTLVCGGAGCGKTLLAMEFLVRGATEYGEPGVFIAFEETCEELTENVASFGFDLKALVAGKKLVVDYVQVDRSEFEETGEYD